jgi:hypothetical protein
VRAALWGAGRISRLQFSPILFRLHAGYKNYEGSHCGTTTALTRKPAHENHQPARRCQQFFNICHSTESQSETFT